MAQQRTGQRSGSVSAAVERRDSGAVSTQVEQARQRQATMKSTIERWKPIIERALPDHVDLVRFVSSLNTVIRRTPQLMMCDPESIVAGAVQAAQLGLEPDGEMCALVPRRNSDRGGQWEASFQLMYKGGIKLARQARDGVHRIVARTVYEADEFSYSYGTHDEGLRHKPAPTEHRGKSVLWYAIAWDRDGMLLDFVVLTPADVAYHKSFSKNANGPAWTKSPDAMARKTCVIELLKLLPKSATLQAALNADDRRASFAPDALDDNDVDPIQFVDDDDAEQAEQERIAADYVRNEAGVIDTGERDAGDVPDDVDPETGERLPLGTE